MNTQRRKRLGYITEEQETAEMLQQTNGGGGGGSYIEPIEYQDPIRYAVDPLYIPTDTAINTDAAPVDNTGEVVTTDGSGQVMPLQPVAAEPTKTINWPLLIAVAIGFYLITKKG